MTFFACCLLAACTAPEPHRTGKASAGCTPGANGSLTGANAAACGTAITEVSGDPERPGSGYTLHFVEFDDQGWAYDRNGAGAAAQRMETVLDSIRKTLGTPQPVRQGRPGRMALPQAHLIVFVHGWKHHAGANDGNVNAFRMLLREVAHLEGQGGGSGREVIGIYVGWRGDSLALPDPVKHLSFWDRKNTAAEVAQGVARELFARLDAMADLANAEWIAAVKAGAKGMRSADAADAPRKRVRTMYIGHSFGGHILVTALGGSVLRDMSHFDERLKTGETSAACDEANRLRLEREGDMIVVVNPAIEGTRFEPLARVARQWQDPCYRAPMFVAVTSEADWATRYAFWAGRAVSTVFEEYGGSAAQRSADRNTLGHDAQFLTHELLTSGQYAEQRVADASLPAAPAPATACQAWDNGDIVAAVLAEFTNQRQFAAAVERGGWTPALPRTFCAGTVLRPLTSDQRIRAPVMNIRTHRALIADHNDIYQPRFVSFLRELYMDTLDLQNLR